MGKKLQFIEREASMSQCLACCCERLADVKSNLASGGFSQITSNGNISQDRVKECVVVMQCREFSFVPASSDFG